MIVALGHLLLAWTLVAGGFAVIGILSGDGASSPGMASHAEDR